MLGELEIDVGFTGTRNAVKQFGVSFDGLKFGVTAVVAVVVVALVVVTSAVAGVENFLRRFFSMPRGRKRLAVLATGFR